MTDKDLKIFNEFLLEHTLPAPVVMLSPWPDQIKAMENHFYKPIVYSQKDFDVMRPSSLRCGTLVLQNVMHYIADPEIAFRNLRESCQWLVVQDLIYRNRGKYELGGDGDCMRYSLPGNPASFGGAWDMSKLGVFEFSVYRDQEAEHFIAKIPGFLT